jgi:type IV pilus assembly protein PilX
MNVSQPSFHRQQRGAIMVISLLLLLIMTVLALGASQATRMQERMAGNARDHDLALQSAEAGIRAGERLIGSMLAAPLPVVAPPSCVAPNCQVYERGRPDAASSTPLAYRADPWWTANSWRYDPVPYAIGGTAMATKDPDYLIEELEEVSDSLAVATSGGPSSSTRMYYRITSRGVGGSDTSVVVLQSTWAQHF